MLRMMASGFFMAFSSISTLASLLPTPGSMLSMLCKPAHLFHLLHLAKEVLQG